MIQHAIIDKILISLGICDESKMHYTPENVILKGEEEEKKEIVQWLVKLIIFLEQLELILIFMCINMKSTSWIKKNTVKAWRSCQKDWTLFK